MKNLSEFKIVFMGTPNFAAKILSTILKNKFKIISVYTQEDKKIGRSQVLSQSAVKKVAQKNRIKIFEPQKFDENVIVKLKSQKPDIIIVAAYGKILPAAVLKIAKYGAINIHPSALPKYRGASPIQNAILNDEKETAVTIMLMEEKVDAGRILSQKKIKIKSDETYPELSEKLSKISADLIIKTIPSWIEGKIKPILQDDSKATFCRIIRKEDGKINWNDEARKIYNLYRAFIQWPGIFTYFERNNRNLRLKLNKINFIEKIFSEKRINGEVFSFENKVVIKSSEGIIVLEEVQLEGKNKMSIEDFVRGYPKLIGSVLK